MIPIVSEKDWFNAIKQSRLNDVKNSVTVYGGMIDATGETGLMLAARLGYESLVSFLLPYEAGQFNLRGETALLIAMQAHKLRIVQLLAPREACVKLEKGGSALHYAIAYEYLDSIPILTKYLKDVPDPEGLLPLEFAIKTENFRAMVDLLYYGQPHTPELLNRVRKLIPERAGKSWVRELDKYISASESHYMEDSYNTSKEPIQKGTVPDKEMQRFFPVAEDKGDDIKQLDQMITDPVFKNCGILETTEADTAAVETGHLCHDPGLYEDDVLTFPDDDVQEPTVDFPVQCAYTKPSYPELSTELADQTRQSPSIVTSELTNYEHTIQQKQFPELETLITTTSNEYTSNSNYKPFQDDTTDTMTQQQKDRAKKAESEDNRYNYFEKDVAILTASFSKTKTPNDILQLIGSSTVIPDDHRSPGKFIPDITASQRVISPRASFRASSWSRSESARSSPGPGSPSPLRSKYSNVERAGSRVSGSRTTENLLKNLVTSRYMNGDTELIYSVKHKNFPMVDQLAPSQHGERDADGKTALLLAAERNNKPMIDVLSQYEAGMFDNDGWTALMRLAAQNAVDSVDSLLGKETRLQRKSDGWTAMMIAVLHASLEMVKVLEPYEVGMQANDGSTALILAIKADRPNVARFLFQKERHICDNDGISGEQWGINLNRSYIKDILAEEARKREEQMDKKQRSKVLPKYMPLTRKTRIEPRSPKRSDALSDGYRLPAIWLNQVD